MDKERRPDPCDYDLDFEKFEFSRRWMRLRDALKPQRRNELYMNTRKYGGQQNGSGS